MKTLLTRFWIASVLCLCLLSVRAEESLRVIDRGTDGDVRYYSVVCPSGLRSSVSDNFVKKEVCTMLVNGKERVCRENWNVDSAAKEACK